jgi:hypothetical protein
LQDRKVRGAVATSFATSRSRQVDLNLGMTWGGKGKRQ